MKVDGGGSGDARLERELGVEWMILKVVDMVEISWISFLALIGVMIEFI